MDPLKRKYLIQIKDGFSDIYHWIIFHAEIICTCIPQTPAAPSLLETSEEVAVSRTTAEDKPSEQEKLSAKTPKTLPSSSSSSQKSENKKKPIGAVSLFGGINVLANKQTKSPLDEDDNDNGFLSKDSPPPNVKKVEKKEEKVKTNTVSLFDDAEDDESDWNDPIFTPSESTAKKVCMICSKSVKNVKNLGSSLFLLDVKMCLSVFILQVTEEQPQTKSTGVFQDEELLFSQTQQKDNDPDVDLFASSGKVVVSISVYCILFTIKNQTTR